MANIQELLAKFREIATNPAKQKDEFLKQGKKIVLCAPTITPEEIPHSMGMVPMGAWGADMQINEAKKYFPAFICNIVQSSLELGITGKYEGCSAIIIPSLSDNLKVFGENWKYAVPSIKFIPMTYPQNRKPDYGHDYTRAGYERVIRDLEEVTGIKFDESKLTESLKIYNRHNQVMREVSEVLAAHPEISATDRSAVFKSAFFMLKEDHTKMVEELIAALKEQTPGKPKLRIMTTGIIADAPNLLKILDDNGYQIVADDMAAESRQYTTDAPENLEGLDGLVEKFCSMDNDTLLYDPEKKRVQMIVDKIKTSKAQGLLIVMSKFVDPEEFDFPLIRRACMKEGIPVSNIEIDRTMDDYAQARTALETFKDILDM